MKYLHIPLSLLFSILIGSSTYAQDSTFGQFNIVYSDIGRSLWFNHEENVLEVYAGSICEELQQCGAILSIDPVDLTLLNFQKFDSIRAAGPHESYFSDGFAYLHSRNSFLLDGSAQIEVMSQVDGIWAHDKTVDVSDSRFGLITFSINKLKDNHFFLVHLVEDIEGEPLRWQFSIANTLTDIIEWDTIISVPPGRDFIRFYKTEVASDGGILVQGQTRDSIAPYDFYPLLIKYDSIGKLQWWKEYDDDVRERSSSSYGITQENDSENIYYGSRKTSLLRPAVRSYPVVYKLDEWGDEIWHFQFDEASDDHEANIFNLTATKDGGVVGVGRGKILETDFGFIYPSAWMFKLDSQGNLLWNRYFTRELVVDDIAYSECQFRDVVELPDGQLVAVGTIQDTTLVNGEYFADNDVWVVKTDSEGCIETACTGTDQVISSVNEFLLEEESQLSLIPNPSHDYVKIQVDTECTQCDWFLFDVFGNKLHEGSIASSNQTTVNLENIPSGNYYIQIRYDSGRIETSKIIIQECAQ